MTLDRPTITREELYEAVWAESMVKVAKIYGLSGVGVAKIAKKLHVPVPGRGYWAKGPMERKLLKEALPWARPNVPTSHSFSQASRHRQLYNLLAVRVRPPSHEAAVSVRSEIFCLCR